MILPATAAANGGLCAQCIKISPEDRDARRSFELALAKGDLWRPSEAEFASVRTPPSLIQGTWNLEPEYYQAEQHLTVCELVERAASHQANEVFLISDCGSRLLVSLNSQYGVCEFQNEEERDWRYAYSEENLRSQVPKSLHLSQLCPCCGVGIAWYPSRTHMPRATAIEILSNIVVCSPSESLARVQWLELGDIFRYLQGRG